MIRLNRALHGLRKHRQSALELAGFVVLAAGVALIYMPAGVITAGLVLVLAGNVGRS